MKYFAYGSNMLEERLYDRQIRSIYIGNGPITGWDLKFNKKSNDNSGKCNVINTGLDTDVVYGVIYEISDEDRRKLDRDELGYFSKMIEVQDLLNGTNTNCLTYIAESSSIQNNLQPYSWYLNLVLFGAEQHKLPVSYINKIRLIESLTDTNENRTSKLKAEAIISKYMGKN